MTITWLHCDRCEKDFRAIDTYDRSGIPKTVGGFRFYNKDFSPGIWERFAHGMEEVICRDCMWADEEYLKAYPHMKQRWIRDVIVMTGMK